MRTFLFLGGLATTWAFSSMAPTAFHRGTALRMSEEVATVTEADPSEADPPVVIKGINIELTPAIVDYVNKKIGGPLKKLSGADGAVIECDVHLSVSKNPKIKNGHRVEVTTNLKGTTIHSKEESPDMYATIDQVADRLGRKLRRYKERRMDGWHGGSKMGDDLTAALEALEAEWEASLDDDDEDDFVDPEAPVVTRIKSFDLETPITQQEAIFALDYTDHDFYVFRDADTNEISVVYKRNAGGIGLVHP